MPATRLLVKALSDVHRVTAAPDAFARTFTEAAFAPMLVATTVTTVDPEPGAFVGETVHGTGA